MITRIVSISLSGKSESVIKDYAEEIADLVDEAMQAQEKNGNIPDAVTYDGVDVMDPDAAEQIETIEPDIVEPDPSDTRKNK